MIHKGSHPQKYYQEVYNRLSANEHDSKCFKEEVVRTLDEIREALLNGTFIWKGRFTYENMEALSRPKQICSNCPDIFF
ncbi:hypothetical protein DM460_22600 [Brevibacillus laterosporus]|nr:hypothetical protein DM460_22600 [Brevibacillus laterosporus]